MITAMLSFALQIVHCTNCPSSVLSSVPDRIRSARFLSSRTLCRLVLSRMGRANSFFGDLRASDRLSTSGRYTNHPECDLCSERFTFTKRRHQWYVRALIGP